MGSDNRKAESLTLTEWARLESVAASHLQALGRSVPWDRSALVELAFVAGMKTLGFGPDEDPFDYLSRTSQVTSLQDCVARFEPRVLRYMLGPRDGVAQLEPDLIEALPPEVAAFVVFSVIQEERAQWEASKH